LAIRISRALLIASSPQKSTGNPIQRAREGGCPNKKSSRRKGR
jgi:hypothetical protein